jgi:N utilization substance protein B
MEQQVQQEANNNARRLARLAAVQGLYQIALTQESVDALLRRFHDDPCVLLQEEQTVTAVDGALTEQVIAGVCKDQDNIDAMIAGAASEKISVSRMEPLLKAILRAGTFELHHSPTVATGIIVNDYVEVAHGFFDAKEPGLVNAILDRLAKTLRS